MAVTNPATITDEIIIGQTPDSPTLEAGEGVRIQGDYELTDGYSQLSLDWRDARPDYSLGSVQIVLDLSSLPITQESDENIHLIPIYDASTGTHKRIPLRDLDGYAGRALRQQVTFVQNFLDGYLSSALLDGYISQALLDGYALVSDVNILSNQLTVLQNALDGYSGGSGLPPGTLDGYLQTTNHRGLDELVHNIAEDSFEEITYVNGNKVSNITVWTDVGKTTKIREEQFSYTNGNRVSQAVTIQYNSSGVAVETLTETFTYQGNRITSITRTLT